MPLQCKKVTSIAAISTIRLVKRRRRNLHRMEDNKYREQRWRIARQQGYWGGGLRISIQTVTLIASFFWEHCDKWCVRHYWGFRRQQCRLPRWNLLLSFEHANACHFRIRFFANSALYGESLASAPFVKKVAHPKRHKHLLHHTIRILENVEFFTSPGFQPLAMSLVRWRIIILPLPSGLLW